MNKEQSKLFDYYIPFTNIDPSKYDFTITASSQFKPYPPLDVFKDYQKRHPTDFKSQLAGFLNDELTIEFKIWWLLHNYPIQELADSVSCSLKQLQELQARKCSIRSTPLGLAEDLAFQYNGIINKQLLNE